VLASDLFAAMALASPDDLRRLPMIAAEVVRRVPHQARGSYGAVNAWVAAHIDRASTPEEIIIRSHCAFFGVKPTPDFVERAADKLRRERDVSVLAPAIEAAS
jgi:hypothetical protein